MTADGRVGRASAERDLAILVDDLRRRVRKMERSNQISRGSVIDHPIDFYDSDEQLSGQLGENYDGTVVYNPLVGPEPPVPTTPVLTAGLRSVTVHWDGLFEPDATDPVPVAPLDFTRVEVHASIDPNFEAEFAETIVGTFETPRGGALMVPLPSTGDDYTFKLVTRTMPGNRSMPSLGATAQASDVEASDGLAPSEAPAPIAVGQIRQVYLAWPAINNADPVVYRIYASGTPVFSLDPDHLVAEVASTYYIAQILDLAPPTPLPYGEDSYFCVVPVDADGAGPPSAVVAAQPERASDADLNDNAVTLAKLAQEVVDSIAAAEAAAAEAIIIAADAQATADGKVTSYFQDAEPTVSPLATNLARNPGAEVDVASTHRLGAAIGPVTRDTTRFHSGVASARVDVTATGSLGTYYALDATAVEGDTVRGRVWVRPDTEASFRPYLWGPRPSDGVTTAIEPTTMDVVCPAGVWTAVQYEVPVTADRTVTRAGVRHVGNAPAVGFGYNTDDVMMMVNEALPAEDFNGATPDTTMVGYRWGGTAHNSRSIKTPVGDLWFDTDDANKLYRWNGDTWVASADQRIGDAIVAIDAKITAYYSADQPWANGDPAHVNDVGDLWIETDAGNKMWHYNSSGQWVALPTGLGGLAGDVTARALGAITTYTGTVAPSPVVVGDMWLHGPQTLNGVANKFVLKRWSGSAWVEVSDAKIEQAISDALGAANKADAKMRIFYEAKHAAGVYPASNPTMVATDDGDLWFRTDANNRLYRYQHSTTSWQPIGVSSSDGAAPTGTPDCDAIAGLGVVHVRISTPVLNTDPVSYEYHASPVPFAPVAGAAATMVHSGPETSFTVRRYPAGALGYSPVYVRVFAKDVDGYGPLSAQEVATPVQVTSGDIAADQGWFGFLEAVDFKGGVVSGDVFFAGGRFATEGSGENVGQGWEAGVTGARWFNPAGKVVVDIPSDLSDDNPALFQGKGVFQQLEATAGMTMKGVSRIATGSVLEVTNAQQAPNTALSVGVDVPYVQCDLTSVIALAGGNYPSYTLGIHWDATASEWLIAMAWSTLGPIYTYDVRIARFNSSGTYLGIAKEALYSAGTGFTIQPQSWVRLGAFDWLVGRWYGDSNGITRIVSWDAAGTKRYWRAASSDVAVAMTPTIGTDGTSLYLADHRTVNALTQPVVQRIDPAIAVADTVNLVPNGTFETDATGWVGITGTVISRSTAAFYEGVASLRAANLDSADDIEVEQTAAAATPVVGGERYDVDLWVRAATTSRNTQVLVYFYDAGGVQLGFQQVAYAVDKSSGWDRRANQIVPPPHATTARIRVQFFGASANEAHYVDSVKITRAAGPRIVEKWLTFPTYTSAEVPNYNEVPAGIVRVTDPTMGSVDRLVLGPGRVMYGGGSPRTFKPHRASTGAQDNYAWPMPSGSVARGIARVNSKFVAVDESLRIFTFTDAMWTTETDQWWAGYTWRDDNVTGSKHETPLGLQTRFTMKKRHRITLTTGVAPSQSAGQDDVTSTGIYLGRAPALQTMTNRSATSTTGTITTPAAHGLVVGDTVAITGMDTPAASLNGTWTVNLVPNANEFRFARSGSTIASAAAPAGARFQRLSPLPRTSMFYQFATDVVGEQTKSVTLLTPTVTTGATNDITSLTVAPDPAGAYVFPTANPGRIRVARRRLTGSALPVFEVDGEGVGRWDDLSPVGLIQMYGGTVIPTGWLICNGQSLIAALYPDLYAALGGASSPYGVDTVAGTFLLPDLAGRFPVGVNPGAVSTAKVLGAAYGTSAVDREERLDHTHIHTIFGQDALATTSAGSGGASAPTAGAFAGHAHGGDTGSKGIGNSSRTVHPMLALHFIIKAHN